MNELKIYDPAMCCDTGVCGVDADSVLITLSSDIDWLGKRGVTVKRFNLAQEPAAFVTDPLIKAEIDKHGDTCLPLFVLNGEVISRGVYPDRPQLQAWTGVDPSPNNSSKEEALSDGDCSGGSC